MERRSKLQLQSAYCFLSMKFKTVLLISLLFSLLSVCGGGGSSSASSDQLSLSISPNGKNW